MNAIAIVIRTLSFALAWWVLTEGRGDSWGVGAVTVMFALVVSLVLSPPVRKRISLTGALNFAIFFLSKSIQGGIQVAFMALRPRLDMAPALLEMQLALPPGKARVMLIYTLNLLPGTVCVGIEGDTLHLHVIDSRMHIESEMRMAESRIVRMLRLET